MESNRLLVLNVRQTIGLYRGNMACKFLYVTPKKFEFKEDGDVKETLEYVKTMTIRAEAFLNQGDKEHLRQIVPVNPESFYWRGNEDARRELYGV